MSAAWAVLATFSESPWQLSQTDYDEFLELVVRAAPTERDFLLARGISFIRAAGHSLADAVKEIERRDK
jgi:hypothetical protein